MRRVVSTENKQQGQPQTVTKTQHVEEHVPQKQTIKQGTVTVKSTSFGGDSNLDQYVIEVPIFETTPAEISIARGYTIKSKIDDYQFARVDVAVKLPCYPHIKELEKAHNFASDTVDTFLNQEIEKRGLPNPKEEGVF